MPENIYVLIMDVGATNIRSIIVNEKGEIKSTASLPNTTKKQNSKWVIWDIDEIWNKLKTTTREVLKGISSTSIKGIGVTTFGADGAFFDKKGNMLYPVISWQCERTIDTIKKLKKIISLEDLFYITGQQMFPFNTILRFLWIKENEPEIYQKAYKWMMVPGIISYKLTGEFSIAVPDGSTMMMLDLKKRDFSEKLLGIVDKERDIFPRLYEAGEIIGTLQKGIADELGLYEGIPVVAAGHDTQMAVYGSGVKLNQPVVSSGTWEILLVRTKNIELNKNTFENSINIEFDVLPEQFNPSGQWISSGVIEWLKNNFYSMEKNKKNIYEIMINEAEDIKPAENSILFYPNFISEAGIAKKYKKNGIIYGLKTSTSRGEIFRALMEGLSFQLKDALSILERAGNFKAETITIVGGGSKNMMWNQIKADVLGIPVVITKQKESTVLGTAIFTLAGAGIYNSADECRNNIDFTDKIILPNKNNKEIYNKLFDKWKNLRGQLD